MEEPQVCHECGVPMTAAEVAEARKTAAEMAKWFWGSDVSSVLTAHAECWVDEEVPATA